MEALSLTSSEDLINIVHLLTQNAPEKEENMKGAIRPISRQRRCPKCKNPFNHIPKLGYICSDCKTFPNRFFIDIYWNGDRIGLYADKQGQPLDTYQRALNLLSKISKTKKNILSSLQNFFSWLFEMEYIEKKPIFPEIEVEEPDWKWIDVDIQTTIISAIPESDRSIYKFLVSCQP